MTEIARSTRTRTGRSIPRVVEGEQKIPIKKIIEEYIAEGFLIWTYSAKACSWLKTTSNYQTVQIIHEDGEFSRVDEDGEVISTNAVEGLFSRVKRFLLITNCTKITK